MNAPDSPQAAPDAPQSDEQPSAGGGQRPNAPEAPQTAAQRREFEYVQMSLVRGRGIVIDTAPQHAKIAPGFLTEPYATIRFITADVISLAEQAIYRITGWDPTDATLTLELQEDWRTPPAAGKQLAAAVDRVRDIHRRNEHTGTCEHCSERDYPDYAVPWPCPTVAATLTQETSA